MSYDSVLHTIHSDIKGSTFLLQRVWEVTITVLFVIWRVHLLEEKKYV